MFSQISLVLAEERARDMRCAAARARRRKEARRAWRAAHSPLGWSARNARDISDVHQAPDSYEDFLCQTAASAMSEPTAAGRIDQKLDGRPAPDSGRAARL